METSGEVLEGIVEELCNSQHSSENTIVMKDVAKSKKVDNKKKTPNTEPCGTLPWIMVLSDQ